MTNENIEKIFFYTLRLEKERNKSTVDLDIIEFIQRARESLIIQMAHKNKIKRQNKGLIEDDFKKTK